MGGRTLGLGAAALAGLGASILIAAGAAPAAQSAPNASGCAGDNGGVTLPPGFCATIFADNLGHVRHLAPGAGGVLYANTWSGGYFGGAKAEEDGSIVALKDTNGDGKADFVKHFGQRASEGATGGSGVAVYKGAVYAEEGDKIVRYALKSGQIVPTGKPQTVVSGMPLGGAHPMHPFIVSAKGDLFVDMGTSTNACQAKDRTAGMPGQDPCIELETRGGTWRYDANKLGQVFSPAGRYATGIRNGEGYAFDAAGRLYVTQHGRDQLPELWPKLYPDLKSAIELPSEEVVELVKGGDYGWPFCYYDGFQKKLVLAPEYGGDGGKAVGVCARKLPPVAAFPAHWAPNDLAIYTAKAFPTAYQGGMFIAFHGSWNRAPEPQAGFNVTFQPFRDGKVAGPYVIFADGFAGPGKATGKADYRPTGLAVGADGALYIVDDVKGRIWRVTYRGPATAHVTGASAPKTMKTDIPARTRTNLPTPQGATAEQVAAGARLFGASSCAGCHGADAKGSAVGPDLTSGAWLWGDGSLASIRDIIAKGVSAPKTYRSPMPAMGGAQLSAQELADVSAYVWAVGHKGH
jgi:glucose/arabinose dehydrogenase/mono/diheme cytochrome c family protein